MLKPIKLIESLASKFEQRSVKAGEIIFTEGETGIEMYGLLSGEVEMLTNDKVVETITLGDVFGERALVDERRVRASTARAKIDCQLILISRERFLFLVQETPMFALSVMSSYSERLIKLKQSM
ncbi:cyclic nucleotide-binding domain-containing protein [Gloeocapsa sp. PCC 73106]|uniref:cyclic nucleotide-binding domain-containing protein n=1 Tax=Gloeocapsa sp. PCC 73106 TaxID=102232 RepID=UPI0002ACA468|nr:cyclic nucleotide-binding domain-containing protein [Gloeocapsa sp. PCC 73106]ELR98998.1 cyclic nucleotide-binding protein [Gloeocapsa sp. PCC 73106]